MRILSSVFKNNGNIPSKYSCDEQGINPPLSISNVPENAKSLALIVDDPDAPMGTFVHWVVFNMDPKITEIKENEQSKIGIFGKTSTGRLSYVASCPPSGTHRYFFKLYALDLILGLHEGSDKASVEKAMESHIIEKSELIGTYKRI